MTIADQIAEQIRTLPEPDQRKVLHYVFSIKSNRKVPSSIEEGEDWSTFSLRSALSGMEEEEALYTVADLKESFR